MEMSSIVIFKYIENYNIRYVINKNILSSMSSALKEFQKLTSDLKKYRDTVDAIADQASKAVHSEAFMTLLKSNSVIKQMSDKLTNHTQLLTKMILDNGDDYDKTIMQIGRYFLDMKFNDNPSDFVKKMEDMKESSFSESVDQLTSVFLSNFAVKLPDELDNENRTKQKTFLYDIQNVPVASGLDYAAQNLAEGCIFVNPQGLAGNTAFINGQPAHLCSNLNNSGYNNDQRIVVELKNRNMADLTEGKSLDEVNETGIRVWCYDTPRFTSFKLFRNKKDVELCNMIDYARVVITHTDGANSSISIEAVEVRLAYTFVNIPGPDEVTHVFSVADISCPVYDAIVDYRSADSRCYCVHKDVSVTQPQPKTKDTDSFKMSVSQMCRDSLEQLFKQILDLLNEFHKTIPEVLKNDKLTNQEKTSKITNFLV